MDNLFLDAAHVGAGVELAALLLRSCGHATGQCTSGREWPWPCPHGSAARAGHGTGGKAAQPRPHTAIRRYEYSAHGAAFCQMLTHMCEFFCLCERSPLFPLSLRLSHTASRMCSTPSLALPRLPPRYGHQSPRPLNPWTTHMMIQVVLCTSFGWDQ